MVHADAHQGAGAPAFMSITGNTTMAPATSHRRPEETTRRSGLHAQAPPGAAASPACRASRSTRRPGPPCAAGPPPSPSAPSPARGPPARWGRSHGAALKHSVWRTRRCCRTPARAMGALTKFDAKFLRQQLLNFCQSQLHGSGWLWASHALEAVCMTAEGQNWVGKPEAG